MFDSHRIELVKTAMHGILSSERVMQTVSNHAVKNGKLMQEVIAQWAVDTADAVIEELNQRQP